MRAVSVLQLPHMVFMRLIPTKEGDTFNVSFHLAIRSGKRWRSNWRYHSGATPRGGLRHSVQAPAYGSSHPAASRCGCPRSGSHPIGSLAPKDSESLRYTSCARSDAAVQQTQPAAAESRPVFSPLQLEWRYLTKKQERIHAPVHQGQHIDVQILMPLRCNSTVSSPKVTNAINGTPAGLLPESSRLRRSHCTL